MHDALRMHQHLDLRRRSSEQPVGLDHLERLVHHGRGVDRDLATHHPVRVAAGLLRRHVGHRFRRAVAERATGCGEQDAAHARRTQVAREIARQALEDRVVLAVDRHQRRAVTAQLADEQAAGHHQRLLVGQQHPLAVASRLERGHQAGGPDDRRHHDRRIRMAGSGDAGLRPGGHFGLHAPLAQPSRQCLGCSRIGQHREFRPELEALFIQPLDLGRGGQCNHLEAIRMAPHDVERVHADRSGRTENREAGRWSLHLDSHWITRQKGTLRARPRGASRSTHRCGPARRHGQAAACRCPSPPPGA